MQNVGKETCAVENDVNMNAEDDEKTTSEAERARNYSLRRNAASSISPTYERNTLDEERGTESETTTRRSCATSNRGQDLRYGCIGISRGLAFHVASTENIILYEGRVCRNAVSAAHASDKSALSFFASPRRSGFVKSALPLFRSVSRCSLVVMA